jgi:ribosome-associated translation inhibitor RaiA
MQIPLQISFRNMDPSPAVEERIRKKAAKLQRFHDRIIGCTVVVEAPHDHAHEDVYVAIRDAFNAATRRLEDQARKMRGSVKTHATPPSAEG